MNNSLKTACFYDWQDVAAILGVSRAKAYRVIADLNKELEKQGYLVVSGKIGKKYFESRVMM